MTLYKLQQTVEVEGKFSRHFLSAKVVLFFQQTKKEKRPNPRLATAMEEEIKAEFLKNGFSLDDEAEILNKCKQKS